VPEAYKRKPNTCCVICKKAIYRRPSEIQINNGRVFCSQNCYGISSRKEKPCSVCGKLILSGLNKKTCNRSCANIQRAGIKYHMGSPKDKVKSQQALKIRLLKGRGRKCERCYYDKYEILQVHHKDRDRNNNNLSNLALICPNCHYEEHFLEKSWLRKKVEKTIE
jgi:predicted nucleic acid-binding Zn ribbon protein